MELRFLNNYSNKRNRLTVYLPSSQIIPPKAETKRTINGITALKYILRWRAHKIL